MLELRGLIHVTAVWPRPDGVLTTLRIGPDTPRSPHDFFALNFARAIADAIVVTGKVLREEPELEYTPAGEGREALLAMRGDRPPPELCVLTSGRGLDFAHPAFHGWARPVVVTSKGAQLPPAPEHVAVRRLASLSALELVRDCQRRGSARVSLEAGPSTTVPLHEDRHIDALMLCSFLGESLPPGVEGGGLGRSIDVRRRLRLEFRRDVSEPSGPWSFELLVR